MGNGIPRWVDNDKGQADNENGLELDNRAHFLTYNLIVVNAGFFVFYKRLSERSWVEKTSFINKTK